MDTNKSRREFLKASAAVVGTTVAGQLSLAPNVHAAGSDVLRVGLIGCGERGTGAATQALNADRNTRLVAMGDMFSDRLQRSLATLKRDDAVAGRVDVKPDHCFTGFHAYKQVLAAGVDVVLLATPPHFRPLHLRAAVDAGKHIFTEKPVAVDAPGVRAVLAACDDAKKKNLSVVSGLCYRYEHAKRETMQRIHEGAVGDIIALHTTYNTGYLRVFDHQSNWSDMEWQLRNWLYFTWLSGDHIVEQHVHSLDKMAWAMKDEYPVRASGSGGRQVRTAKKYGNIFDHHCVVYEYKNGVKLFSYCRQQKDCDTDVTDYVMGTKATCDVMKHKIHEPHSDRVIWRYKGPKEDMYDNEHEALFASIRSAKPINNGNYMCKSTLMAIIGRMATYTGKAIGWDQALDSKEDLTPAKYEFGPLPVAPVAMPGITQFA
ncbi:MAG TPA: Gfo/Idh/MocA family oxidoreductase [Gemmataceae bacterium]|nr:Gfo/Idh/MocA family oxidoreductase [Gemmataceae bacterium]